MSSSSTLPTTLLSTTNDRESNVSSINLSDGTWTSLANLRTTPDPSALCTGKPRLAKDESYAKAVLTAWKDEFLSEPSGARTSMGKALEYPVHYEDDDDDNDDTIHSGYLVVPSDLTSSSLEKLPIILLFHTGAGPQDVFLRWKADSLVCHSNLGGGKGCIVFVADMLSDPSGWAWSSDRSRYNSVRTRLLRQPRTNLRRAIDAALHVVKKVPGADENKVVAMGWCLGGQSIAELGRMRRLGVLGLVSFHGVFDGIDWDTGVKVDDEDVEMEVLLCNGKDDPFVSSTDLERCQTTLQTTACQVQLLDFEGVRHGFTNPAQDCNPSEAFRYDDDAANRSWAATNELLRRVLE